ncbi:FtsQ-type POTRA domain-containing protein [bacterium]|nr:FtsQ-type POTRA domain-containing protein [bacterium]
MKESDFDRIYNNKKNETSQDEFSQVKHSVRHKQKERKIRKKRKKVNRLKSFLKFGLLVLLIFLTYEFFTLPGWYLAQDTFTKPNECKIEVLNNKIVPTYIIYNALKDVKVPHQPIFMMSVKPIKREIYQIPVMKNVFVRRYGFPARLQIIIRERIPIAIIKTDLKAKPAAFFTSDGVLVTNKHYMNLADNDDILKILTKPQTLKKEITVKRIREIEKIVKEVENYSGEKVEYIDMRNPNDVFVKIKTTSIRLGTLDSTVFERIKRIYTILPQITEVNSNIQYIDLSWDKVNYLKMKKNK